MTTSVKKPMYDCKKNHSTLGGKFVIILTTHQSQFRQLKGEHLWKQKLAKNGRPVIDLPAIVEKRIA